ncbi:hypothetical protein [Novosphingobium sp. ES2-1]|jgi:hypothetical protein|uniref:hypothetical protein n=1 Tax=Novosphingobium sp. ES2-1 TaxID=2780074 RepID=UPI00187E8752|nr:hypothetical protein [Novosphingobium sp. ES2-1]QOV94150.1 hypothetical protein IM701_01240 [Novosphingobium sp. ES2-1]
MRRAPANAMPLMPKGTGSILAMTWNVGGVHGKFAKVQSETLQLAQGDRHLARDAK